MKKYESIVLIKPELNEKQLKEISESIIKKINEFAKVTKIEDIGKRKLAYEVKKNKEAYYILYNFEVEDENSRNIAEIERFYRITDEILKFIVVKVD